MAAALRTEDPGARTVPYMLSGGTDAKHFAELGMRCFGFAPLRLPPDLDFASLFHGIDERVPVDALRFGARVLDTVPANLLMDLTGKAALVTGGASGIGAAAVRRLAAAGAVVAIADRDEAGARALAAEVGGLALPGDVSDPALLKMSLDIAEDAFGRLTTVLLNAGITAGQSGVENLDIAGYRRIMAVNVDHVVFGLTAAVPALRRAGGGHIVVTASLAGLVPMPGDALYTLTKHAVVGYVRAAAPTLAAEGSGSTRSAPASRTPRCSPQRATSSGTSRCCPRRMSRTPSRPSWSAGSRGSAGSASPGASPRPTASAARPGRPVGWLRRRSLGRPLRRRRQIEISGSIRELRRRRSTILRTPPG